MNEVLSSTKLDCTPIKLFRELDQEFHFDLDPAASDKSAKCVKYFTPDDNGLTKDWGGCRVFCNPPSGKEVSEWVKKGYEESKKPDTIVVMLIPAKTDTSYFHEYILHGKASEIRFLRGRIRFTDEDGNARGAAMSPSAIAIWRSHDTTKSLKDMILELIRDEPMTANEIAAVLTDGGQKVSRSDVGPILTKAQTAGVVKNAGKRECSVTSRSAIAWAAESEGQA